MPIFEVRGSLRSQSIACLDRDWCNHCFIARLSVGVFQKGGRGGNAVRKGLRANKMVGNELEQLDEIFDVWLAPHAVIHGLLTQIPKHIFCSSDNLRGD